MIIQFLTNLTPGNLEEISYTELLGNFSTPTVDVVSDECLSCKFIEDQFADTSPTATSFTKDQKQFLRRKALASDTIVMKLFLDDVEVATLNTNAYGTYFPTTVPQPLYVGYLVDWTLVFLAFGGGIYKVVTEATILSNLTTSDSAEYRVMQYSSYAADGSVRIDTIMNSNIEASEFNYIGLNWFQSVRLPGRVSEIDPDETFDSYLTTVRDRNGFQMQTVPNYSVDSKLISGDMFRFLSRNNVLTDQIFISDYNQCNAFDFKEEPVFPKPETKITNFEDNANVVVSLKFTRKRENYLGRKFN